MFWIYEAGFLAFCELDLTRERVLKKEVGIQDAKKCLINGWSLLLMASIMKPLDTQATIIIKLTQNLNLKYQPNHSVW